MEDDPYTHVHPYITYIGAWSKPSEKMNKKATELPGPGQSEAARLREWAEEAVSGVS